MSEEYWCLKRGTRELRTGGSIVDFCKKKKLSKNVKIEEGPRCLTSKNNKKGIFQRTFSRLRVSTRALLEVFLLPYNDE